MPTRKEEADFAISKGMKQFVSTSNPCKTCGGVEFFSAGRGSCKKCKYEFTKKKRASVAGGEREVISRKKSYEKRYSKKENREKKAESDRDYIKKVKSNEETRAAFLEKKRIIYRRWYYSKKGHEKALSNVRAWYKENPHHILLRKSLDRMRLNIGTILCDKKIDDILLYSKDDFINHIQSTMSNGMSFDDRTSWHIDHILPVSWFVNNDLLYPEIVNSLYNLKAETADYNLKKNNKWKVEGMTEWDWCYMLQWMVYGEIRYKEGG